MLPTTIKAITQALLDSADAPISDVRTELLHLAIVEIRGANGSWTLGDAGTTNEEREHILRAIAYLVRRLELDAHGPG